MTEKDCVCYWGIIFEVEYRDQKKKGARGRTYGEIRLRYVKDGTSRDTPSILTYHKEQ